MSTLAESFLHDLDESSGDEEEQIKHVAQESDIEEQNVEEDVDDIDTMDLDQIDDPLTKIAVLFRSNRLKSHLANLDRLMNSSDNQKLVDVDEFEMIIKCNHLIIQIDNEVIAVTKFLRDIYSIRFPELERLVPLPLDYARVVQHIQNKTDVQSIDLTGIVAAENVMVIAMSASIASETFLADDQMAICLSACDAIIQLHQHKTTILHFVESRMSIYAPNITALVGSSVASRVIALAGGLHALSKIPSCDIQVLGHNHRLDFSGFSRVSSGLHEGILMQCDLVARQPSNIRKIALKKVAAKVALAARSDCFASASSTIVNGQLARQVVSDSQGKAYREYIIKSMERLLEPDTLKKSKALPAPVEKQKRKRGGKRHRKSKEKFEATELSKQRNRMAFGTEEVESYGGMELGMVNAPGSGRVRLQAKDTQKLAKLAARKMKQHSNRYGSAGGTVSGFSSSLAFTPVQGLELVNPNAAEEKAAKLRAINEKYFNSSGGFSNVTGKRSRDSDDAKN